MNILQAINQKSFNSNHEMAMVNLLYTYNWFRDKNQVVLKAYDLKMQHYNVLRILQGSKPNAMSPGDIKQVMLDKAPDLTRLVDKLVKMELVERNVCPENRRKIDVYITEKGTSMLKEITQKHEEADLFNKSKISDDEAKVLSDLLDRLRG